MRRIIALSILILTLVVACDSSPAPTPTLVPVPTVTQSPSPPAPTLASTPTIPPPRSNITRADYNAALAKWQGQGITDYEISVYQLSLGVDGVYRLRVQGDAVTVLSSPDQNPPNPTATPYPAYDFERSYTVAALFTEVNFGLAHVERGSLENGQVLRFVYKITFDPVWGYPRSIDIACNDPAYPATPVCPTDTFVSWQVQSLTVLATATATARPVIRAGTVTTMPTVQPPRSNITRADYNAALVKWRSQVITNYEISVYELSSEYPNGGVYRLQIAGDQITMLSRPYYPTSFRPTPTPYPTNEFDLAYTVANLFAEVDDELTSVEQGGFTGGQLHVLPYVYNVTFDSALGYPNYINSRCSDADYPAPHVCPSDSGMTRKVVSLTVLTPTLTVKPTTSP